MSGEREAEATDGLEQDTDVIGDAVTIADESVKGHDEARCGDLLIVARGGEDHS